MWNRLLSACAALSALIIGAVVVLVSYDVIARNMGLWSPAWIVDLTEYALPLSTLLVAPWLTAKDQHIKIDLVATAVPMRLRRRLDRMVHIGCGLICAVIAYYAVNVALESYETQALVIKNIVFPEWWVYAPVPVCFALLTVECLRRGLESYTIGESAPIVQTLSDARG